MTGEAGVRAATLLGPNTVDGLERIVDHLKRRGFDAAVAPPPDVSDISEVGGRAGEFDVDLLWACGLLTAELVAGGADLDVVAAPVFTGETSAVYHSVIIARAGARPAGRRLAINEYGSWSGYRALFHDAACRADDRWHPDLMNEIVVTGAHVESVAAVAAGRADVAAIDHSVWDWLVTDDHDAVVGLSVVDKTVDYPAPPLSIGRTVRSHDRARLVDALLEFDGAPTLVPASIDDYRFMLV